MAKAKSIEGTTKSDLVREYLRSNPPATANQIVADLRPYGVSLALAKKVKSKEGRKRREAGRKPGRATSAPAARHQAGTKTEAIRQAAEGMPKPVRPRDVVAALAEQGIEVARRHVGQVLKSMGLRRRRRGRTATASGTATVGRPATVAASATLSLEALLAAKKLADQLGVDAAKQAVDALARLS
ncbi:MAG TPA: hypothetical protein VNH11_08280 [Pirellulales bacterium]|nr:hypothetical protein [Pirellulales bacterium]